MIEDGFAFLSASIFVLSVDCRLPNRLQSNLPRFTSSCDLEHHGLTSRQLHGVHY